MAGDHDGGQEQLMRRAQHPSPRSHARPGRADTHNTFDCNLAILGNKLCEIGADEPPNRMAHQNDRLRSSEHLVLENEVAKLLGMLFDPVCSAALALKCQNWPKQVRFGQKVEAGNEPEGRIRGSRHEDDGTSSPFPTLLV